MLLGLYCPLLQNSAAPRDADGSTKTVRTIPWSGFFWSGPSFLTKLNRSQIWTGPSRPGLDWIEPVRTGWAVSRGANKNFPYNWLTGGNGRYDVQNTLYRLGFTSTRSWFLVRLHLWRLRVKECLCIRSNCRGSLVSWSQWGKSDYGYTVHTLYTWTLFPPGGLPRSGG